MNHQILPLTLTPKSNRFFRRMWRLTSSKASRREAQPALENADQRGLGHSPNKHFATQKSPLYIRRHCLQMQTLYIRLHLLAGAMKPLKVLSKFENRFVIRTVRFQVQLEADGCFSAQKIFVFASAASRASWYQLAIFWIWFYKSDFKNDCWASPKPDIQHINCADCVS